MKSKTIRQAGFLMICIFLSTLMGCYNPVKSTKDVKSLPKVSAGRESVQPTLPNPENFRDSIDGKKTALYILKNKNGMQAAITNYGGRLVSLLVPDKNGKLIDVVTGFSGLTGYRTSTEPYFGATIGRYGNRIAKGSFMLYNKKYQLYLNNGPNTLHGGKKGFQDVVWTARQNDFSTLDLFYQSPDGEEHFPGNLSVQVTYHLTDKNELRISYEAETDRTTIVNLTNHAFFNLNGFASGDILHHELQINAERFLPVDSSLIPTGQYANVRGTPFDFTKLTAIGKNIGNKNQQLLYGKGYDHNFVLNNPKKGQAIAIVKGDQSGVIMKIYTDQPGLQFYSGNFMQGKNKMKGDTRDLFRNAFALETQHFPDSPNQPSFPSTILNPGEIYKTTSTYQFGR